MMIHILAKHMFTMYMGNPILCNLFTEDLNFWNTWMLLRLFLFASWAIWYLIHLISIYLNPVFTFHDTFRVWRIQPRNWKRYISVGDCCSIREGFWEGITDYTYFSHGKMYLPQTQKLLSFISQNKVLLLSLSSRHSLLDDLGCSL
jgi:hypothetical protein